MRLNGVFATEGEDWRRQRRIVTAALNRQKLTHFFPKLALTVARLRRRWEGAADRGEFVDVCGDLTRFTVDVTMQLAFSVDANTLETPGPVIQRHLDKVFPVLYRRSNAPFAWWRLFRLPSDRALDRAIEAIEREVDEMIHAARQRMAADPDREPADFLEAMLAAAEEEGSGIRDAEVFANAGNLLLAGEDTTANSIAWAMHYFMLYPELFERGRGETDALLAPAPALENLEQANRLPVLDAFCNEVMRIKPVAPLHVERSRREKRDTCGAFGEPSVVKGLVGARHGEQRVDLAMDIGQRLDRPHRMVCQQARHQPIRDHQALSVAEPDSPPEGVDPRRRQYALDLTGELRNSAVSRSSLQCHGDPMIGDLG